MAKTPGSPGDSDGREARGHVLRGQTAGPGYATEDLNLKAESELADSEQDHRIRRPVGKNGHPSYGRSIVNHFFPGLYIWAARGRQVKY